MLKPVRSSLKGGVHNAGGSLSGDGHRMKGQGKGVNVNAGSDQVGGKAVKMGMQGGDNSASVKTVGMVGRSHGDGNGGGTTAKMGQQGGDNSGGIKTVPMGK